MPAGRVQIGSTPRWSLTVGVSTGTILAPTGTSLVAAGSNTVKAWVEALPSMVVTAW